MRISLQTKPVETAKNAQAPDRRYPGMEGDEDTPHLARLISRLPRGPRPVPGASNECRTDAVGQAVKASA